jgi:hypothetical protein
MPVSASRPRRTARTVLVTALTAGLLAAGVAPVASVELREPLDVIPTAPLSGDYEITLERVTGTAPTDLWPLGDATTSYLELRIENLLDAPQEFALAADLTEKGVVEQLWLNSTWNALELAPEDPGPGPAFRSVVEAGGMLERGLPDWPGKTYQFYRLADGSGPLEEPELLGTFVNDGGFVPFSFDYTASAIEVGTVATVSGSEIFPGATATVTAQGLTPGQNLDLWLAPDYDYYWFIVNGARLPAGSVDVGQGVVDGTGKLSAFFEVPADTEFGSYQLLVGDAATRTWPAGTVESFPVVPPTQSASGVTPAGSGVALTLPVGPNSVDLSFPTVSTGGSTTVVSSTTGPAASAFLIPGSPQLYFHIDTTADYTAPVTVCISYNAATVSGTVNLYHYTITGDQNGEPVSWRWENITTTREPGKVCGITDSFSPFALGIPTTSLKAKEECKNNGWRTSTVPAFKNQGECVSYFTRNR